YIDGQIPAEERLRLVDRFNGGEGRIFLISLRAGGTGLNLTGADTVIHFDPWWNPAVEEQATDRVYRIGQENVVQVIKLYTRHSVEEKIYRLQERKQKLVDALIQPGQNLLSKMSLDEVLSLFEIQDSRIPRSDI
ncbi:MAG: DEAD/DEAH box helicase, partial [Clostridia bacterium]|nr:DEAD/DEAH box helicase [Clostridia bacterium]